MGNYRIDYAGKEAYYNNDNTLAPYLQTRAKTIYLNSNCSYMFNSCMNIMDFSFLDKFNMEYVTNCFAMFRNCRNFNQPITISNNVINCSNMFYDCYNFNQPIDISNNVTDCSDMFYDCYNFNQPINIPNSVIKCANMFRFCNNFNQPIEIPNNVTNCANMFYGCSNIGGTFYLPNSVTNCRSMFGFCNGETINVHLKKYVVGTFFSYIFRNTNDNKFKYLYCNVNTAIEASNMLGSNSILGKKVTFTQFSGYYNYYNSAYHTYIITAY